MLRVSKMVQQKKMNCADECPIAMLESVCACVLKNIGINAQAPKDSSKRFRRAADCVVTPWFRFSRSIEILSSIRLYFSYISVAFSVRKILKLKNFFLFYFFRFFSTTKILSRHEREKMLFLLVLELLIFHLILFHSIFFLNIFFIIFFSFRLLFSE